MPSHCRMRVFDRDLIRGGHYGQRSCEPHLKAEHMAAPTKPAYVKKALANLEPSTHGTKLPTRTLLGVKRTTPVKSDFDPLQNDYIADANLTEFMSITAMFLFGTSRTSSNVRFPVAIGGTADIGNL